MNTVSDMIIRLKHFHELALVLVSGLKSSFKLVSGLKSSFKLVSGLKSFFKLVSGLSYLLN